MYGPCLKRGISICAVFDGKFSGRRREKKKAGTFQLFFRLCGLYGSARAVCFWCPRRDLNPRPTA